MTKYFFILRAQILLKNCRLLVDLSLASKYMSSKFENKMIARVGSRLKNSWKIKCDVNLQRESRSTTARSLRLSKRHMHKRSCCFRCEYSRHTDLACARTEDSTPQCRWIAITHRLASSSCTSNPFEEGEEEGEGEGYGEGCTRCTRCTTTTLPPQHSTTTTYLVFAQRSYSC